MYVCISESSKSKHKRWNVWKKIKTKFEDKSKSFPLKFAFHNFRFFWIVFSCTNPGENVILVIYSQNPLVMYSQTPQTSEDTLHIRCLVSEKAQACWLRLTYILHTRTRLVAMNTFNRSLVSKEVAVTPKGVIPTIPLSVSAFCQVALHSKHNPGEMLTRQRAVCNIVTALLYNGTDYRFSSNLCASTFGFSCL